MVAEGCRVKKNFFKIIVSQLNRRAAPIRKPSAVPNTQYAIRNRPYAIRHTQ
jgi:hypothetical protein